MVSGYQIAPEVVKDWIRGRGRNSLAVVSGTITTAVLTALLFAFPVFAPTGPVKEAVFTVTGEWIHANPYTGFRYWGGIGGGIVAGAIAEGPTGYNDWASAITSGVKAASYGLILLYVCYLSIVISVNVFSDLVGLSLFLIFPIFLAIPLLITHLFGGIVGGIVGNAASRLANGEPLL